MTDQPENAGTPFRPAAPKGAAPAAPAERRGPGRPPTPKAPQTVAVGLEMVVIMRKISEDLKPFDIPLRRAVLETMLYMMTD